jgi:DNA-binding transcriptional LysR family regulator
MHFCMLKPTQPSDIASAQRLDWALLQSFAAVMRKGSLSAAAGATGQTQPTLSRHIRLLEEALGERLFDRRANALLPTERASALFERAVQMENAALAIERLAAGAQEEIAGTVRVAVPELFGMHLLPKLLASFQVAHPQVAIELVPSNSTNDLLRREADIAVRLFRSRQPDLIVTKVGMVTVGLFAHPTYLARHPEPITLESFHEHRWIGDDEGDRILRGMADMGLPIKRSDFAFRTDSILAQVAAIEAGIGIGAGLTLAFENSKAQRVLQQDVNIGFEVFVVTHADIHRSRRIRSLYDWLVRGLRDALKADD